MNDPISYSSNEQFALNRYLYNLFIFLKSTCNGTKGINAAPKHQNMVYCGEKVLRRYSPHRVLKNTIEIEMISR